MNMKKLLALLLAGLMMLSLVACGNDDTNNNIDIGSNNNAVTSDNIADETTDSSIENSTESGLTNEIDTTDETVSTQEFISDFDGTYELDFADFDESILSYECILSYEKQIYSDGFKAGFIPYPSTKVPENPIIERLYTRDDLFSRLYKYIDMKTEMDANILVTMEEKKFDYTDMDSYWDTDSSAKISGSRIDYYFLGHPDFSGLVAWGDNEFSVDEIYYDNQTGNFYIILVDKYSSNKKDSNTSYALLYIKAIDEFAKSHKIGKGYVVYRP